MHLQIPLTMNVSDAQLKPLQMHRGETSLSLKNQGNGFQFNPVLRLCLFSFCVIPSWLSSVLRVCRELAAFDTFVNENEVG